MESDKRSMSGFRCNYVFYSGQVFGSAGFVCDLRRGGKHVLDGPIEPTKAKAKAAAIREARTMGRI